MKSPAFSYRDREIKGLINECLALLASIRVQKSLKLDERRIDPTKLHPNKKTKTKIVLKNLLNLKLIDKKTVSWDDLILLVTCNKNSLKLKKDEKKVVRELYLKGFADKDNWDKFQYFYYAIFSKIFNVREEIVMNYFRNISSIIHTLVYNQTIYLI